MKTLKFNKNAGLITVLTAALFGCLSYIIRFYNNNAHYEVQDWLINYQAGFVRRGLPGELAFHLASFFDIKLRTVILFFQIGFYSLYIL